MAPIAIVSDIHGNLAALEAVVADARARGANGFWNLGDGLSGPLWPADTADYLIAQGWPTITGNHERQLLNLPPDRMNASDRYAQAELRAPHWEWLRSLPDGLVMGDDIILCHGTPRSDLEYGLQTVEAGQVRDASLTEMADRFGDASARIIFCGHTHLARATALPSGIALINPGSVGLPAYDDIWPEPHKVESGTPHARYALFDGTQAQLLSVPYDHEAAARKADKEGRGDWAHALRTGYCLP